MKVLILPKDSFPLNRPMLTEFWRKEMVKLGCYLFWIVQSNKITNKLKKKVLLNNVSYIFPSLGRKQLIFRLINFFLNIFFKFFLAVILIKKYKIQLIHIHNSPEDGLIALILIKIFKARFTYSYTSHFLISLNLPIKDRNILETLLKKVHNYIRKKIYIIVLKNAAAIFPISQDLVRILHVEVGIPIKKMIALPECASSLFLKKAKEKKAKTIYDIIKLVYIGSLGKRRNINFIVDTFEIVKKKYSNIELYLIGWGERNDDIPNLKTYIYKKKLDFAIKFKNKIPYAEVPNELSKFDIGLSLIPPLDIYLLSTPTKCIEYLSSGLPIVANLEIHDQKRLIDLSGGGILTKYETNEAANAILKLIFDTKFRRKSGERGYKWIKENRTFSKIAPLVFSKLKSIERMC